MPEMKSKRPSGTGSSWSFNLNKNRGAQSVTLYGSASEKDPGWTISEGKRFVPIGSFDTTQMENGKFNAVSLKAAPGKTLGSFRWIVWKVSPVSPKQENTAFQELEVVEAQ